MTDTDDLLQRLREVASEARAYSFGAFADEAEKAADEIERLRAEVADIAEEVLAEQRQRLKAESELAALRGSIAGAPLLQGPMTYSYADEVVSAVQEFTDAGKRVRLVVDEG